MVQEEGETDFRGRICSEPMTHTHTHTHHAPWGKAPQGRHALRSLLTSPAPCVCAPPLCLTCLQEVVLPILADCRPATFPVLGDQHLSVCLHQLLHACLH